MLTDSEALVGAIRQGNLDAISALVAQEPALATAYVDQSQTRTPLHVAADWPGFFPNGPQVVRLLIAAGGDPNARYVGKQPSETPLHWAASSDDADVARALIDGGANVDSPDGSIGTPIANAVGYGCWNVAHLLVQRGARVDDAWVASALGLSGRLDELVQAGLSPEKCSQAFWHACAGGQRRAAEFLLERGADPHWVPTYSDRRAIDVAGESGTQRENLIAWLRERLARR